MNVLVTGNKSGLGKYLFENIGTVGLDRDTTEVERAKLQQEGVDVIIHCAFNSSHEPITFQSLNKYMEDNYMLTDELIRIPHKKFIFFSSVDIYPQDGKLYSENTNLDKMILKVQMGYECTKILSEAMIGARCSNHLILRCTAFLGEGSRKNSLKKIIEDENPTITLTPDSEFNYVLYKDVLKFINTATEKDLQGIYNIASSENIELSKVAEMCKKQVQFGSYTYKVGKIDNTKAISVNPEFKKTSKQVIQKYITIWQKKGTF